MAKIAYPLAPYYYEAWDTFRKSGRVDLYVKRAMQIDAYDDADTCSSYGGYYGKIDIFNVLGQVFDSKYKSVNVCMHIVDTEIPQAVTVTSQGMITIYRYQEVGLQGVIRQLVSGVLRTLGVMTMLGSLTGVQPLAQMFTGLQQKLGATYEQINDLFHGVITTYQKSMAWIDRKLKVNCIQTLNSIGRALVPEYDLFWRQQENKLAHMSGEIFGNTATLASYIHIVSLMYYDMALAESGDPDDARYQADLHSAKCTEHISNQLDALASHPDRVWSILMEYTFGEENPYLDKTRVSQGLEIMQRLKSVTDKMQVIDDTLTRLGAYAVDFNKVNLGSMFEDISKGIQWIGESFDTTFDDFRRTVEQKYSEQMKAIEKLEKEREAEQEKRERAYIITSDPDTLPASERAIQTNHFLKTFDYAVPGFQTPGEFQLYDIEDLLDALK